MVKMGDLNVKAGSEDTLLEHVGTIMAKDLLTSVTLLHRNGTCHKVNLE